ncbi:MAG: porin [Burkholderiaceae bacterium]
MKKTLIALAAVAATGAAFAQSSVTLYGVADVALTKQTGTSASVMSAGSLNNGTSRWGVRGTEDLGGGLKAGFNFEQGLSLGDGSLSQAGAGEFGRAAWMNLAGGFGDLRLGRSLSPNFYGVAAWELTGTANYSVVGSQFGITGPARNSAQIMYTTPNMGGFTVSFAHVLKGNNGDNGHNALNAVYKNGPLAAGFAYAKTQNAEDDNMSLGASYSFGQFKIGGSFQDPAGDARGFTLGGTVMAGPVSLTLDIARDTEFKDTNTLFEVKYPLSKRTFTYVAFVRDGEGKNAEATNNLGLGIRHNF